MTTIPITAATPTIPSTTYKLVFESLDLSFVANAVALGLSEGVTVKTGAGVLVELLVGLLVGLLVAPESGKVPFKLALDLVALEPSQM